jgi:hypothetical protein
MRIPSSRKFAGLCVTAVALATLGASTHAEAARHAKTVNPTAAAETQATMRSAKSTMSALAAPASSGPVVAAVRIERVKPARERYPTLQFLKANRDFIRSRFDLLRERAVPELGLAGTIDPRFLAYRRMIADATASDDSLTRAEDASRRWELFANITDLGRLEDQLDLMDRQLAEQKARLGALQLDFTGRQLTSLAVVLSGFPAAGDVNGVTLVFEPGDTLNVPLSADVCQSLRHGGLLELCHRLVEPREQTVAITLHGGRWDASAPGFVELDPARDQLSFLRLDLGAAQPSSGASSMAASRWIHDTGLEASRGPETQP